MAGVRERYWGVSTHAPRAGSDIASVRLLRCASGFNSRSPSGERPPTHFWLVLCLIVSTHAPRAGSDSISVTSTDTTDVSTHAPRAGSDAVICFMQPSLSGFQLTLPERGATNFVQHSFDCTTFQLTLPERGATRASVMHYRPRCFNSRSPSGERPHSQSIAPLFVRFNSRSPSGERPERGDTVLVEVVFQLTLPERGATARTRPTRSRQSVSTHAPRAGSDIYRVLCALPRLVSTHAPRAGSDPHTEGVTVTTSEFQLTLPERGATKADAKIADANRGFNSRSPSGERHLTTSRRNGESSFNSRSPSGERPIPGRAYTAAAISFNSRSPSGERRRQLRNGTHDSAFQLTLPERGATTSQ